MRKFQKNKISAADIRIKNEMNFVSILNLI